MNFNVIYVRLHALTVKTQPKTLKKYFNTAASFLAAGLDTKKNIIFVNQSSAHADFRGY